jgi:hypothetical protein
MKAKKQEESETDEDKEARKLERKRKDGMREGKRGVKRQERTKLDERVKGDRKI